jgi:hypothetical protein
MPAMGMKAVITSEEPGGKPCLIYWTGQVRLHVGVLTYCNQERKASEGVLQVPDDVECCVSCEENAAEHKYPSRR